jgi:hypothetical protein
MAPTVVDSSSLPVGVTVPAFSADSIYTRRNGIPAQFKALYPSGRCQASRFQHRAYVQPSSIVCTPEEETLLAAFIARFDQYYPDSHPLLPGFGGTRLMMRKMEKRCQEYQQGLRWWCRLGVPQKRVVSFEEFTFAALGQMLSHIEAPMAACHWHLIAEVGGPIREVADASREGFRLVDGEMCEAPYLLAPDTATLGAYLALMATN